MDLLSTGIFELAERRLAWADERQQVLAQNVANANTPGYEPRDLPPFQSVLGELSASLTETNPLHLASLGGAQSASHPRPAARSPDGNAVAIDEQLTQIADTDSMHELAINLYHTYMGMFRTAFGQGG